MQDKLYEIGLKVEKEITPIIEGLKKEYLGILLEETRALSKELENIDIQNYNEIIQKIEHKRKGIDAMRTCGNTEFMKNLEYAVAFKRCEDKSGK